MRQVLAKETKIELDRKRNGFVKEDDLISPSKKLSALATLYSSLVREAMAADREMAHVPSPAGLVHPPRLIAKVGGGNASSFLERFLWPARLSTTARECVLDRQHRHRSLARQSRDGGRGWRRPTGGLRFAAHERDDQVRLNASQSALALTF